MNVPKLRFKDDDGRPFPEWESNLLGSYAEAISSGKSNARNGNGRYILYGSTGSIGYADDYDYQGEKLLIARVGANAGYLYRVEGDYCVSDNTLMLTLKQPHNYSFFFNLLTKKNLNKLVFGSGQPLITGGHLKNLEVSVPSLPEQTKIANFLTAVDEKIQLLTQKSDLLSQYKKGVMQKIFSQELRFKDGDGQEFPEWKKNSIDDLFSVKAGGDISKDNVSEIKTEKFKYPVFANSDKNYGLYGFSDIFKIETNAITVTGRGNLGVAVPRYEPFYPIVRLLVLIPKCEFNVYFGATQINNINFHSESTGVPQLTVPQLSKYEICYPVVKEQTKIANFLTAIDDKITQTQAELYAVKQYKQGLLQQMFV
jgi:type I restriction enzyme S subunit